MNLLYYENNFEVEAEALNIKRNKSRNQGSNLCTKQYEEKFN